MIEILEIMGYVPPINWCKISQPSKVWTGFMLINWSTYLWFMDITLDWYLKHGWQVPLKHGYSLWSLISWSIYLWIFMDIYGYKIPWTLIYWALFKQNMLMVGNLMFNRGITENVKKSCRSIWGSQWVKSFRLHTLNAWVLTIKKGA